MIAQPTLRLESAGNAIRTEGQDRSPAGRCPAQADRARPVSLLSVYGPDSVAQNLQSFEHRQRLLSCPMGRHPEGRWRLWARVHAAALRERSAVLRAARSTLRAASRSSASFCR
jgi:hypothetical protein